MQETLSMSRREPAGWERLRGVLACTRCGSGGLRPDEESRTLSCGACDEAFRIIGNVPCFVDPGLVNYSEIAPADRERFLEAKRVAYFDDSFVRTLYTHYHRYAATARQSAGAHPLTVDIGFGIGEHYDFIRAEEKAEGTFIGVDIDRFKLEHFSAFHPEVPVLQANAFSLPFVSASIDVVQLLATLEHFSPGELPAVIDESLRVLKPGGMLIACYPAEGSILLRLCQVAMHLFIRARTGFDLEREEAHRHPSTARQVRDILRARRDLDCRVSIAYPFRLRSINLSLFINETYVKKECRNGVGGTHG